MLGKRANIRCWRLVRNGSLQLANWLIDILQQLLVRIQSIRDGLVCFSNALKLTLTSGEGNTGS